MLPLDQDRPLGSRLATSASRASVVKYLYWTVYGVHRTRIQETLNTMGALGFHVVHMITLEARHGICHDIIFERPYTGAMPSTAQLPSQGDDEPRGKVRR